MAIAVSGGQGTVTKEVETGLGSDREANMVAFAVEALKLLEDVMQGKQSQGGAKLEDSEYGR